MTKTLSREIKHRSKLKNIFNTTPTEENKRYYTRQRKILAKYKDFSFG